MNNPLRILEEKHVIDILFFLMNRDHCMKSDIYKNVSTNSRMPVKLDMMEKEGLITQSVDTFKNNTTTVSLTPKGRKITENLIEVGQIMIDQGDFEDDKIL